MVPGATRGARAVSNVAAALDPLNVGYEAARGVGRGASKVGKPIIDKVENIFPRTEHRAGKSQAELGGPDTSELMRNAAASSEIVPGSQPTAIQAAMQGRWGPADIAKQGPTSDVYKYTPPGEYGSADTTHNSTRVCSP